MIVAFGQDSADAENQFINLKQFEQNDTRKCKKLQEIRRNF
jgi:hypothetical protein